MTDTIHSCGYHCQIPGCIKAQRDELVAKYVAQLEQPTVSVSNEIRRLAAVALSEAPKFLVTDWQVAAMKVCKEVVTL